MKYVIIDHEGLELPIIFDDIIQHSSFSHLKPVSAGVVRICGGSTSLNLKSRPEDEEIITKKLMEHYH